MAWGRGKCLVATLAAVITLGAIIAGAQGGAASAVCLQAGDGCPSAPLVELAPTELRVMPQALPRRSLAPIAFRGGARISSGESPRPPALREAILQIDRDVYFDVDGLPVCAYRQIASRDSEGARRACPGAIVGRGEAELGLAYPENTPIEVTTETTLFNGGARRGAIALFVHGVVPIPRPQPVVARVRLEPAKSGEYGWDATVEIPRMGDGYGTLLGFAMSVRRGFAADDGKRRSFLRARCSDGRFALSMPRLLFRNDARRPGVQTSTVLKGAVLIPCHRAR